MLKYAQFQLCKYLTQQIYRRWDICNIIYLHMLWLQFDIVLLNTHPILHIFRVFECYLKTNWTGRKGIMWRGGWYKCGPLIAHSAITCLAHYYQNAWFSSSAVSTIYACVLPCCVTSFCKCFMSMAYVYGVSCKVYSRRCVHMQSFHQSNESRLQPRRHKLFPCWHRVWAKISGRCRAGSGAGVLFRK